MTMQTPQTSDSRRDRLAETIRFARLMQEKCELRESKDAWLRAYDQSKALGDLAASLESLQGLLRLSGEALDHKSIARWEMELDLLLDRRPHDQPPPAVVWLCKGSVALRTGNYPLSQRYFRKALKGMQHERQWKRGAPLDFDLSRAWYSLAFAFFERGKLKRAQSVAMALVRRAKMEQNPKILGYCYQLLGRISEKRRELEPALRFHQEAHSAFLVQHDWYSHLTVLLAYARVARQQTQRVQAEWYLELLEKAAPGPEFGSIRREVEKERALLEEDSIDLLIDSHEGLVRTRDSGSISVGKQYVLLNILQALADAHEEGEANSPGLSKAEIIEKVWHERYRPEAHDNKLYYNINRLRKLIEPDVRKPKYLLNWREGYRLAPGLRVQMIGNSLARQDRTARSAPGLTTGSLTSKQREQQRWGN